jgi:hypothetical protein
MLTTTAKQGLFGATIHDVPSASARGGTVRAVQLGELSENFKESGQEPTITGTARVYCESLSTHVEEAATSRDFLKRAIQMPHFSTIATTLMMTMQYKDTPLDEDVAQNTKLFSVLNMLIADENDAAYTETIGHTTNTDLEEALGTASSKRQKINMKAYVDGRRDTPAAVVGLLANTLCELEHRFKYDLKKPETFPTLVTMLIQIADKITTPTARKWFSKHLQGAPWIPIMLVDQIHGIVCQFVKVCKNPSIVRQAKEGVPSIDAGHYNQCFTTFEQVIRELEGSIANRNLGVYRDPPPTYKAPAAPPAAPVQERAKPTPQHEGRDKKRKAEHQPNSPRPERPAPSAAETKGWIVYKKPGVWQQPTGLNEILCRGFIQQGKFCGFSSNGRTCKFGHKWLNQLPAPDQQKWCQLIDSSADFELAEGQQRPTNSGAAPVAAAAAASTATAAATAASGGGVPT